MLLYTPDSFSWDWIIFISEKSIDIIFSLCSFFNLNTQPRSSCLIQGEYSGEQVGNTALKKQNSESFSLLAVKSLVDFDWRKSGGMTTEVTVGPFPPLHACFQPSQCELVVSYRVTSLSRPGLENVMWQVCGNILEKIWECLKDSFAFKWRLRFLAVLSSFRNVWIINL